MISAKIFVFSPNFQGVKCHFASPVDAHLCLISLHFSLPLTEHQDVIFTTENLLVFLYERQTQQIIPFEVNKYVEQPSLQRQNS